MTQGQLLRAWLLLRLLAILNSRHSDLNEAGRPECTRILLLGTNGTMGEKLGLWVNICVITCASCCDWFVYAHSHKFDVNYMSTVGSPCCQKPPPTKYLIVLYHSFLAGSIFTETRQPALNRLMNLLDWINCLSCYMNPTCVGWRLFCFCFFIIRPLNTLGNYSRIKFVDMRKVSFS